MCSYASSAMFLDIDNFIGCMRAIELKAQVDHGQPFHSSCALLHAELELTFSSAQHSFAGQPAGLHAIRGRQVAVSPSEGHSNGFEEMTTQFFQASEIP